MTFQMKDKWNIPVTAVADDFIDHYMAAANGEYVKVYLYILRHRGEALSQEMIADGLNNTESDVRRALAYWEKAGVLSRDEGPAAFRQESAAPRQESVHLRQEPAVSRQEPSTSRQESAAHWQEPVHLRQEPSVLQEPTALRQEPAAPRQEPSALRQEPAAPRQEPSALHQEPSAAHWQEPSVSRQEPSTSRQESAAHWQEPPAPRRESSALHPEPLAPHQEPSAPRQESAAAREPGPVYSAEQVNRLSGDEEFAQLLYIAQKYMNKVFTPRDCQVFAYLYDSLKFSPELLEYLVEYCVQNGHMSLRYMETVALNWHKQGFKTPEEAKEYTDAFNSDAFGVMKAFGLGDRRPGTSEQKTIRRWFRDYGFDRELVLMACNRTIAAIHNPSFQYADKILSDWKQAGVRTKADVEALDEKRAQSRGQGGGGACRGQAKYSRSQDGNRRKSNNQFHNFKERDTDYDALVLKQLKERVEQQ